MVEEHTRDLMKIVQETCAKQIEMAKSIVNAESKLDSVIQDSKKAHEVYQKYLQLNQQIYMKLLHLDDSLPKHEAAIAEIIKETENICCTKNNVQWQIAKAKLILENENSHRLKYHQMMEQFPNNQPTDTATLNLKTFNQQEIALKKKMLQEKKHALEMAIQQKRNECIELLNIEKDNLVLKKRNNALLLRLKRQLQESESRHKLMLSRLHELEESVKEKANKLHQQKVNK